MRIRELSAVLSCAVFTTALLSAAAPAHSMPPAGSTQAAAGQVEPAPDQDLAARVLEISHEGGQARVVLELVLSTRQSLRAYRLFEARLQADAPRRRSPRGDRHLRQGLSSRQPGRMAVPAERALIAEVSSPRLLRRVDSTAHATSDTEGGVPAYITRHTVVLERGLGHGLLLSAETEDAAGELRTLEAYVQVNLDPEQQPELLDGLVQYRAQVMP